MHLCKTLFLVAIGLLCINARLLQRQKKCRQRPASAPNSCGCPLSLIEIPCGCKSIIEPTYGSVATCNCQNIFLDELPGYSCGCKYVETYGVLNPEVPNYGRVPSVKLPKIIANFDAGVPIPAINLPGLYDFVIDLPSCSCQAMPPYFPDLPCQAPMASYQIVESPCSCRAMQRPIVEYLSSVEVPSPILKVPYAEPYYIQSPKCQPQVIQLPSCPGCSLPKIECGCQNLNMPCGCQNVMNGPCGCESGIKVSYGSPCGCQNSRNCGCQNVIQYGPQLPALDAPCACQSCQLSPVELPVFGCGCQSLPPPVTGCGACAGKYLRQVALQPPFL